MRSPFLKHGRAVLIAVPFLIVGCNDNTPPSNPDPVVPPAAVATPTPPPAPGPNANLGCDAGPGSWLPACEACRG